MVEMLVLVRCVLHPVSDTGHPRHVEAGVASSPWLLPCHRAGTGSQGDEVVQGPGCASGLWAERQKLMKINSEQMPEWSLGS